MALNDMPAAARASGKSKQRKINQNGGCSRLDPIARTSQPDAF